MKKTSAEFGKICGIFGILCKFLSLPQISDYHHLKKFFFLSFHPIALRMAKTPQSFGHSKYNRVK